MARVHFLTLTHLQESVLYPIFQEAVLRWDCAMHQRRNQEECVDRLLLRGCKVIVACEIYDNLWSLAREAGIATILVQHGQFIVGSGLPGSVPDVAIMTGEHYAEYMRRAHQAAGVDGTVEAPGYIRAETCLDAARSELEHDGVRYLYAMPVPGEYGSTGFVDWLPVLREGLPHLAVKPHPRSGDKYNAEIKAAGCRLINPRASIYRWLAGLDLLICGPSNLIFEAAMLHIPCVMLNPQKSANAAVYGDICHVIDEPSSGAGLTRFRQRLGPGALWPPYWTPTLEGSTQRVVDCTLMHIDRMLR